jgi:hypothetical protein
LVYLFSVLICCTKKNLATLRSSKPTFLHSTQIWNKNSSPNLAYLVNNSRLVSWWFFFFCAKSWLTL